MCFTASSVRTRSVISFWVWPRQYQPLPGQKAQSADNSKAAPNSKNKIACATLDLVPVDNH
jgi:hypothetical protein